MIHFVCDTCGTIKGVDELWINGIAAENVGTQAARREVVIDPLWRYDRAVQPFAVHFCSVECKDDFLAQLFQKPAKLLEMQEVETDPETGTRIVRAKRRLATEVVKDRARNHRRRTS